MNDGFSVGTSFLRRNFEYYQHCYLVKNREYPQDYPAVVFKALKDNEKEFLPALSDIGKKARSVYEYFDENSKSKYSDIWKLNMGIYETLCDSFLTVYEKSENFNEGKITKKEFSTELERVISLKDKQLRQYPNSPKLSKIAVFLCCRS